MNSLKDRAKKDGTKVISGMVKEQIMCPVCKKVVHNNDLPDKDSVIIDNVYYVSGFGTSLRILFLSLAG